MLARVPATWLPGLRALLESRGGVAKWWHRVHSTMEEALGDLWGEVEGVEGAIQARADAIVQAELDAWNALDAEERRRRTFEREKQALEAKILKAEVDAANRKLGIEPDDPKKKKKDGEESEDEEAPEDEGEGDVVRRLRKRHAKTQRRVLEMYRRATSLVYGVSQITLHSNATKVEVALEGLDLFAELPCAPPWRTSSRLDVRNVMYRIFRLY